MHRFSDFATDDHQLEGDKIPIEEVMNKEIVVTSFRVQPSKFNKGDGQVMTLQIDVNNEKRIIFTSSVVLRNQVQKYQEQLPFIAQIKRINNKYLSFV